MKNIKFILLVFISVTVLSCSSDSKSTNFTLTNANIAGTYKIGSLETEEKETATSSSGTVVNISTTTGVADSFDKVSFVLNTNGTYTATGRYRFVTTETPNGGSATTDFQINIFDAAGTYAISNVNNTITLNQSSGDFIDGVFTVDSFTEKTVKLSQEKVETEGGITTNFKGIISLVRN